LRDSLEESAASRSGKLLGPAAFLVAAVMLFSGLGSIPLMQPDEGRNAEVGREMAVSGSWLVPTLEGHPYLDKPAAYFAAVALSIRMFGAHEWAARLPSVACGLAILTLLYLFARRQYDSATAAFCVIVVATSPMALAFSRIVIMDNALALCTTAAILAAFVAEDGETPDRRWHAVGAAAAGLGTLVKGPVGALVPAAVLVVFFWADGRPRALRRVFAPVNVLIVLGVVLPWFGALVRVHPEFARYGLVEETLNRFFTPAFNRGQPFWYYGPAFLAAIFPWTVIFVPMAFTAWSARARLTRADRLFIAWTIVVVVFFSMSRTKQLGYILPGVIAAAVCVGRGVGYAWRNREGRAARLLTRGALFLAAVALALAAAVDVAVSRGASDAGRLAAIEAEARVRWSAWPALMILLLVMAALGILAYARRHAGLAVAAFALFPLLLVTVGLPAVEDYANTRSAKALAGSLSSIPDGTEIACLDDYPAGLSFYLGRTLTIISEDASPLRSNFIDYWLRLVPVRPPTLVARSGRDAWLDSRQAPAFIVAPDRWRADLESWVGSRVPVRAVAPGWWGAPAPRPAADGRGAESTGVASPSEAAPP
jgi:dolichyl-phosphate-mannose-protein mannosyltransferase